jgi:glycosyltransferase involved in cell wall biosynthesis
MADSIVHFVEGDTLGGCEEVVKMLLWGLDRRRWRPILFHQGGPRMAGIIRELSRGGIMCRNVPPIDRRNAAKGLWTFVRELRNAKAVFFHAHLSWALGCRYELIAAKLARVPAIVATSHLCSMLPDTRISRWKRHLQSGVVGRYIAVSDHVKKNLRAELHLDESKVTVVRNGIQVRRFGQVTDTSLRATLTHGERPIVLTPARLHAQKGMTFLLQAAALIPEATFVIAGDGPERRALEDSANKLNIGERVRFLGHRQDIPDLLANCDLFVLPSIDEGLPLSVLEAMAASKPVIATCIGGTNEAVIDGVTGLLVPPRNPSALAAAINKLLYDPSLAARLGEAGKARAISEFSSEAMIRGVTGVYDEIITSRSRVPRSSEGTPASLGSGV